MIRRHGLLVFASACAAALAACGPEPFDVSGPWSGTHSLIITGSETASGSEGIVVSQSGRDINFYFAGCNVNANQSGDSSFDVYDFRCTRLVNQKTWTLYGDGKSRITASTSAFNMTLSGDAESGQERSTFTWSFNGTR